MNLFRGFPALIYEGREGGVSEPHLLKPKGLGGSPFPRVCGKKNGAVVRLYPRKMVDFRWGKEGCLFGVAQSSIKSFFNGGLLARAFIGPRKVRAVKT